MSKAITPNERKDALKQENERGVALIIVLLVTALLIALIFEFAYGTRISLRAAVNFRDSERAAYLARSGVNFAGRYLASNLNSASTGSSGKYMDVEHDWQTNPLIPELKVKWEDESAKINVYKVKNYPVRQAMLKILFANKQIDTMVLDRMLDSTSTINDMTLLTGLHRFMNDEDYEKVAPFLTVNSNVNNININTASEDVLLSLGISAGDVRTIKERREQKPIEDLTSSGPDLKGTVVNKVNYPILIATTDNFKVYSYATVGGYTKQVEAVIHRNSDGKTFSTSYWRSL